MARGKKTGGGSRKGIPNGRTIESRSIAMRYVTEAIVELADLMPRSPEGLIAMGAAVQLLDRAALQWKNHYRQLGRTHRPAHASRGVTSAMGSPAEGGNKGKPSQCEFSPPSSSYAATTPAAETQPASWTSQMAFEVRKREQQAAIERENERQREQGKERERKLAAVKW